MEKRAAENIKNKGWYKGVGAGGFSKGKQG